MDEKPYANTYSTINEVLVVHFPSSEAVLKDNQVERENDVSKFLHGNKFRGGKPGLLEASVTTSERTLGCNKIEMGNEVLDSQQEKTVMVEHSEHLEICVESSGIANEVFINQSTLSEKKIGNDNIKLDNVELKFSEIGNVLVVEPTISKISIEPVEKSMILDNSGCI